MLSLKPLNKNAQNDLRVFCLIINEQSGSGKVLNEMVHDLAACLSRYGRTEEL